MKQVSFGAFVFTKANAKCSILLFLQFLYGSLICPNTKNISIIKIWKNFGFVNS